MTEERNQRLGSFVEASAGGERVWPYVPAPLPPNPPLDLPQLLRVKELCTTGKERRIARWEHEGVLEAVQRRLDESPQAV